jgi:ParB-like chromosome segregation protein Spo0J
MEIKVYCAFDEMVPTADLKEHPKNPNKHPQRQIKILSEIIKRQGWRAPVTVSNLSGLIVRGHGRLLAARHLGLDKIPVDYQDYVSEDAEIADLIADNKIAELSELDQDLSESLLKGLDEDWLSSSGLMDDIFGEDDSEMKDLKILKPPETTWVLIQIPTIHFFKIAEAVERISKVSETKMFTTITDKPEDE